jgi:hypothetical protein
MRRRRKRRTLGARLEFAIPEILAWADAHQQRTGKWPKVNSGLVRAGPLGEKWRNVDTALRIGLRGLSGGSSLAQLLAEERHVRHQHQLPPLRPREILAWGDVHYRRTGSWPTSASGPIPEAPGESWRGVDQALRVGLRGLPGGSSLAQFLAVRRGVRNLQRLAPLTYRRILDWADAHHQRTGVWPTGASGPIPEAPGETWRAVDAALLIGRRGLPGGSSLARFLAKHRGTRNLKQLPPMSIPQVLRWARAHRRRTGHWPTRASGPITEAPGETWSAVHAALATGCRGLPAGETLARLLQGRRGERRKDNRPLLTEQQILAWADAHRQRTGAWPHSRSGPIRDAPGETWRNVDHALHKQLRGLTNGVTLAQLLTTHRGLRTRSYAPALTEKQILAWADAYEERTGTWPHAHSGPIPEAPGETWRAVDDALQQGSRGLRGDRSLARLLAQRRGVRNRTSLPRLRVEQILAWADGHHRRTGAWPTSKSGPVRDAPDETWKGVDMALHWGYRGLRGGTTLARLLAQRRGVRNRTNLPRLDYPHILNWASAHHRRTGAWPTKDTGQIASGVSETWQRVDQALRRGYRGLPGGLSLARLLHERHNSRNGGTAARK